VAKCPAITRSGEACKGIPIDDSGYCYAHHPDHAQERRAYGSKGGKRGGRGRPQAELEDIKATLYRIASEIENGEIDTRTGAVLVQVFNSIRGCVEDQRKIKETEELEARLSELEEQLEAGKPGYRGA
jgi:hypothetical protein